MKTGLLDTPAKRIPIAVAVLALLTLIGAGIYFFLGNPSSQPVNAQKILAAAHAYTRVLVQSRLPVPHTISLQALIDQKYLEPADVGSFQGLDAQIFLTATGGGPQPLMTVRLPDGANLILFPNGTSQKVKQ